MKQYYYSDGKQQIGPLSKEELASKSINKDTLIWFEGLPEWIKAGDVEDLADLFKSVATPPPMPGQKIGTPPPMPNKEVVIDSIKNNKDEYKSDQKKKTKRRISWLIVGVLLLIISYIATDIISDGHYHNVMKRESENPRQYLTIKNNTMDGNNFVGYTLSGQIVSSAKYWSYDYVQIKVTFKDDNDNILQIDNYTVLDNIFNKLQPGGVYQFSINVNAPKGIKNKINSDYYSVEVTNKQKY